MAAFTDPEAEAAFREARRLHAEGRRAEAGAACDAAAERWPRFAPVLHLRGFIALEMGDLPGAEEKLRAAVEADPADPGAYHSLGIALRRAQRPAEAAQAFQEALRIDGRNVAGMNSLALALLDLQRLAEALEVLLVAARQDPSHPETHHHLGLVLERQGRLEEARAGFRKALALKPELLPPRYALGKSLLESGHAGEAEAEFRECLRRHSDWPEARAGLALALELLGRGAEAEALLRSGAASDEMLAINLGSLLARARRFEEALRIFDAILERSPGQAVAHHNRANVLARMERSGEAEGGFRRAIALQPRYADPHFGLSLLLLARGAQDEGWREFSWRPQPSLSLPGSRALSRARDPETIRRAKVERAIEIVEEQGIGDMLFFLRWARALADGGWRVVLRCSARLAGLVGRTGLFALRESLESPLGIDSVAIPAGDLPLLAQELGFGGTKPRSLEITPLADCLEAGRRLLEEAGPGPYLGITWRAGTRERALGSDNLTKEVDAARLLEALQWRGTVIALQRNAAAGEIEDLRRRGHRIADFSAFGDDLEALAGLLAALDDYAGVSNTNVHLLAALGRRARIAVPSPPEWRWAGRKGSDWFPGFAIVRQRYGQSWDDALPPPGAWKYPEEES